MPISEFPSAHGMSEAQRTNQLLELISDQLQLIAAYLAAPVAANMADSTMLQPAYLRVLHMQIHEARKHLGMEGS